MPPPSKLAVATSSLVRLVKEEASYYKEMEQQEARIRKLEAGSDDENAEYLLKQEVCYLSATLVPARTNRGVEARPAGDQERPPDRARQDHRRPGETRGTACE